LKTFFSAAKLFHSLPCHFLNVHHLKNELHLKDSFAENSKIHGFKLVTNWLELDYFLGECKQCRFEVMNALLAGLNFFEALFE